MSEQTKQTPTVRVRRVRTTPAARALVEQIDAELQQAHARAASAFAGLLAAYGITGPARIVETAGTKARPVLVIEIPAKPAKGTKAPKATEATEAPPP